MNMWKWIGLAGLIGVAAVGAGVLISRRTREYEDLDDAELSERLHQRLEQARARSSPTAGSTAVSNPTP
jgi:hypothetical protein